MLAESSGEPDIPGTGALSRFTWQDRLEAQGTRLESYPWLIIAFLAIIYVVSIGSSAFLILWHDELFTYYIAQAGSLQRLITDIRLLDLNPPLVYLLTGISQHLFGDSPFATRLPEIIAFFFASIGCLYFVARRAGLLWGAVAVLILWYSPAFYYATQARPYALVLAFFSLTLVSWDAATRSGSHRQLALAGVLIGNAGMMASHVFGIFSIGPFLLAEMVRFYRRRTADWPLWACLLLPLGLVGSYVPLMNRFQAESFPAQFQGGPKKLASFYAKFVVLGILPGLIAAIIAAFAVARRWKAKPEVTRLTPAHTALLLGFLLPPVLINGMLMRTHGAFWPRYCITTAAAVYLATALVLAYRLNFSRLCALSACAVLAIATVQTNFITPYLEKRTQQRTLRPIDFDTFHADLPFIAASGVTFLEMDHNQSAQFDKRLYYLTNRAAALQYAHTTIFEGLAVEKNYFPVRGQVVPYNKFLSSYHHFLVIVTMLYSEDWLLQKLKDDGGKVTYLGEYLTPYKDNTSIYEVTMPPIK